jgi:hypothetical protein
MAIATSVELLIGQSFLTAWPYIEITVVIIISAVKIEKVIVYFFAETSFIHINEYAFGALELIIIGKLGEEGIGNGVLGERGGMEGAFGIHSVPFHIHLPSGLIFGSDITSNYYEVYIWFIESSPFYPHA